MASDRVNFVNENNAGSILLALLKQIANTRSADAHKHLDEVRTRNREEENVSFAGNSACQQCLAGSWRAHHQDAFGNAAAEFLKLLWLLEKLDNLLEFFLRFFNAGNVLERNPLLLIVQKFRARLAKRQSLVSARLHLPQHEDPDADKK